MACCLTEKAYLIGLARTPDRTTFSEKKELNKNWKILRGNNELVRALSNALNGRYKLVKDGDVAHSNTVTLLNSRGQIQVQASGTLNGIQPIIDAIEKIHPNSEN